MSNAEVACSFKASQFNCEIFTSARSNLLEWAFEFYSDFEYNHFHRDEKRRSLK